MKALISMAVVVIVATIFIFNIETQPTGAETKQTEDSSYNILVLGCDESGLRPDSILLVNVDSAQSRVSMLSIPRDTKIQMDGASHKINSCIVLSGKEALFEQVRSLTGVPIDYYIMLKTGVFAKVVDALGGVEYTVEKDMKYSDPAQNLYINLKAGTQTLTGDQCEQYCRYRKYAMGDLTRTKHQQQLLKSLVQQKAKLQYVTALPKVYNILKENAETDITPSVIAQNLPLFKKMTENTLNIQTLDAPGEYNDMKKDGVCYYLADKEEIQALCKIYFRSNEHAKTEA